MANLFCQHKNTGVGAFLVTRNFFKRTRGGRCHFSWNVLDRCLTLKYDDFSQRGLRDICKIPPHSTAFMNKINKVCNILRAPYASGQKGGKCLPVLDLCPKFSCCGGTWKSSPPPHQIIEYHEHCIIIYRKSIIRDNSDIISHQREMNLSWDVRHSGWWCDCVVAAKEVLQIICLILMMTMMRVIMMMMAMMVTTMVMMMMVWW